MNAEVKYCRSWDHNTSWNMPLFTRLGRREYAVLNKSIGISMLRNTQNMATVTNTNSALALFPRVVAQLAACEEVYRRSDNKSSCPSEQRRDTTA